MTDYKTLYFLLFNGIADIIEEMEKDNQPEQYIIALRRLLNDTEEAYLTQEDA